MTDNPEKETPDNLRIGTGAPGPGRPKGVPNKLNQTVKEMILTALDQAGGVEYLATQAVKNPKSFMALLGRVLPLQVTGEDGQPIAVNAVVQYQLPTNGRDKA